MAARSNQMFPLGIPYLLSLLFVLLLYFCDQRTKGYDSKYSNAWVYRNFSLKGTSLILATLSISDNSPYRCTISMELYMGLCITPGCSRCSESLIPFQLLHLLCNAKRKEWEDLGSNWFGEISYLARALWRHKLYIGFKLVISCFFVLLVMLEFLAIINFFGRKKKKTEVRG